MSTKILIIDHNDSFTYNLVQLVKEAGAASVIVNPFNRMEDVVMSEVKGVILSPGPGLPEDYPETFAFLQKYNQLKPFLGVCLGLQLIVKYFGGKLMNLSTVKHGQAAKIKWGRDELLFKGISFPLQAGLYHSWAMDKSKQVDSLQITSELEDGTVMSVKHTMLNIRAVQFHPESFITQQGIQLMKNWLDSIQ